MKEMEKRIVEAFPKAREYMDIENEFWKAFSNWCDMKERMSTLYKDKDEKSRDIVRKSEFYKEISQDLIDKYPMILHELQIIQIEERRAGWNAYQKFCDEFHEAKNEYLAAREQFFSIPEEVWKAKCKFWWAKYWLSNAVCAECESEFWKMNLEVFLADNDECREILRSQLENAHKKWILAKQARDVSKTRYEELNPKAVSGG